MKPYDIYNLWAVFDKATTDPAFSTEQKIAIGKDMLAALPPEMLCSSSKPSLEVVTEAMKGRLNDLNSRSTGKTGIRTGTSPVARPEGDDSSADEGRGVSVEDMERLQESPIQPQRAKRKSRSD